MTSVAAFGPRLVTTIVYTISAPGPGWVRGPLIEIERSADPTPIASGPAAPVLFAGSGSGVDDATAAVFWMSLPSPA